MRSIFKYSLFLITIILISCQSNPSNSENGPDNDPPQTKQPISLGESQKIIPSDATYGEGFGTSIEIVDNELIIGAASGIYIYQLNEGTWEFQYKFTIENVSWIGPMDVYKNTLVVGAGPGVFIFEKMNNEWKQVQELATGNWDVAIHDDKIITTTYGNPCPIYTKTQDGWEYLTEVGIDTTENIGFGHTVAINNHYAAVSSPQLDGNEISTGGVFAYDLNNNYKRNLLLQEDPVGGSSIYQVVLNGNSLLASGDSRNFAILYQNNGSGWDEIKKFEPSSDNAELYGDNSVFLTNLIAISSHREEVDGATGAGAVYLYLKDNGEWKESRLLPPNPRKDGLWGQRMKISNDYLIIGDPANSENGTNSGAVLTYKLVYN